MLQQRIIHLYGMETYEDDELKTKIREVVVKDMHELCCYYLYKYTETNYIEGDHFYFHLLIVDPSYSKKPNKLSHFLLKDCPEIVKGLEQYTCFEIDYQFDFIVYKIDDNNFIGSTYSSTKYLSTIQRVKSNEINQIETC